MRKLVPVLCLIFLLSGCASTVPYKIRVGDELRIVVFDEVNEKALVRPDKKISLPLIGVVSCKDKTPEELSRDLSKKYRADAVVMVTKFTTLKDDLKDFFRFVRDFSFGFLLAERISHD